MNIFIVLMWVGEVFLYSPANEKKQKLKALFHMAHLQLRIKTH